MNDISQELELKTKTSRTIPSLHDGTGNAALIRTLAGWGITTYAGVNGGGVIHFAKYLEPLERLDQLASKTPSLFTISEGTAGFIPVGYGMGAMKRGGSWQGKIMASLLTTGGAAYLGASGILGAKMHDIPALYVMALSSSTAGDSCPLQYTGKGGAETVNVFKALLGDGCVVIDDIRTLEERLGQVQRTLGKSTPAAILFHPDILSQQVPPGFSEVSWSDGPNAPNMDDLGKFLSDFPKEISGKKAVIYVGEEAQRYPGLPDLITQFAERLQAPVLYSMNSVNAVSSNNRFAAGYIHLGFNDFAKEMWDSLTLDDTVVAIGFDPGEYEMNSGNNPGNMWHLTNLESQWGSKNGGFAHRTNGRYRKVRGDMERTLSIIIKGLEGKYMQNLPIDVPQNLNKPDDYGPIKEGTIDLVEFFREFVRLAKPNTMMVHDVCQGYKDFQRVIGRPLENIRVSSAHRDSLMSHALGVEIGLKFENPSAHVDCYIGDGGFEYIGAQLARARNFGLTMWVIANGNHHVVDTGLDTIYKNGLDKKRHHAYVPSMDYASMARAQGWDGINLTGLGQLGEVLEKRYANEKGGISTLIVIPVDGQRVIGQNPRLLKLGSQGQLNL